MGLRTIPLIFLLCLSAGLVWADDYRVDFTSQGYYLLDSDHSLTVNDILVRKSGWIPIEKEFALGLTPDTVWVKFPLSTLATPAAPREPILFLSNPLLNHVQIYLSKEHRVLASFQSGDHAKIQDRPFHLPELYWRFPGSWKEASTLLVKIRTDSFFETQFFLFDDPGLLEFQTQRYWMLGLFYGSLGIMFFYNLFLYFQTRDKSYLYYICYVASVGLFQSFMDGLPYYYFSEFYDKGVDRFSIFLVVSVNISAILFVIHFLDIQEGRIRRAARTLMAICAVGILVEIMEHDKISIIYHMSMTVVSGSSIFYIAFCSWRNGKPQAKYFLLAWVVLVLSIPVYLLTLMGYLPTNPITLNSIKLGVMAEVLLLSFSLAHRISILRKERLEIQRRYTQEMESLVKARTSALEEANQRLKSLSETDALTQLKNRAYLEQHLETELSRATRRHSPVALLMLDLDHFKRINDQFGHGAGDYCLQTFAKLFQQELSRPGDLAGRYGGEEFMGILADTDISGALDVAERIRAAVENHSFTYDGAQLPVTVSIGIYAHIPDLASTAQEWERLADQALYTAKTRRNCVAVCHNIHSCLIVSSDDEAMPCTDTKRTT